MNTGTICYDCHSGLGHLAKSFFDAGVVNRVLICPHPHYPRVGWFPPESSYVRKNADQFLRGLDALLLFENALYWDVASLAKKLGIAIVLMPNYEYTPFPPPVRPDLVWCPSLLDQDYYAKDYRCQVLTPPVDVKWKLRQTAEVFVHNAGHGQRGWAKGTPQILDAMKYVKSPIKLIVRGQPHEKRVKELLSKGHNDPRVEIVMQEVSNEELWDIGDVFVNAEQYNGISLMLQEARASGMLVMSTDRYPMNIWLPTDPLIPVDHYEDDAICVKFKRAVTTPQAIAAKMDEWYGRDIQKYSKSGQVWANENSWQTMKPAFMQMMERAVQCRSPQ